MQKPLQHKRLKQQKQEQKSLIAEFFRGVIDMIFPRICACCNEPLEELEHTICTKCRLDMPMTNFALRRDNAMVELMAARVDFDRASALMFFRQQSHYQDLLHRMKYSGRDDIARVLGEIYGLILFESGNYSDVDIVVPVPLHWSKIAKRGYNQSEEFAKGIAKSMGIRCMGRAIRRTRATRTQARLKGKEHRVENVNNAFSIRNRYKRELDGKVLLLVDDIVTTGATLESTAYAINQELPNSKLHLGAIAIVAQQ
ncbi:MAG: ComF family protein [Rikenellaceae bacterium]